MFAQLSSENTISEHIDYSDEKSSWVQNRSSKINSDSFDDMLRYKVPFPFKINGKLIKWIMLDWIGRGS